MKFKRIVKETLKRLFQGVAVPIRQGENKGKLWTVSSCMRMVRGTFESTQVAQFKKSLFPGNVVYDVGAHMGYYTLIASQAVEPGGFAFAFEPLPFNFNQLQRHIRLNHCHNVTAMNSCVGRTTGIAHFTTNHGSGTNHMSGDGDLVVNVMSLDDLVSNGTLPLPNCIKIDVEGAELEVLFGAQETIARSQPILFVSFHGQALQEQCSELLQSWGYYQQGVAWYSRHKS
jgi:FkbM family methyltransferase